MELLKHITAEDIERYGVVAAPDKLEGTPQANKMVFDRLVREMVAGAFNNAVDVINATMIATEEWGKEEAERVEAELARIAAENLRADAETARAAEETARSAAETIRETNERNRQSRETAREQAEENRADAESAREAAEQARKTQEATRAMEETARVNGEVVRRNNEQTRQSQESTRQTNEQTRQNKEAERQQQESTRQANEQTRQTAEQSRASGESARGANEKARAAAEELRVSAETSRTTAENLRASAETNRASAENLRAAAETDRASAEAGRKTAETSRVTAESKRETAETNRASAETARGKAEQSRASAETSRNYAENLRKAGEIDRINAENLRVDAEEARVAAEKIREEAYQSRKVVQETGNSTTAVMSQAAVTKELSQLSNEKVDYDAIFTVTQVTTPNYTNLISTSEDEIGDVFNGIGYMAGKIIESDGSLGENASTYVSGFIPVEKGNVVRIKDPSRTTFSTSVMLALYKSTKATAAGIGKTTIGIQGNAVYGTLTIDANVVTWDTSNISYYNWDDFAYLRVTTFSAEMIVTVNQELTESTKDQLAFRPEIKVTAENLDFDLNSAPLAGKTVALFGDSLIGMYRGSDGVQVYAAQETGATVHNVGFGGCRMSVHPTSGYAAFSMWALAKAIAENDWTDQDAQASSGSSYFPEQVALLKSIDFSKVDIAVIHYGTNDFAAGGGVTIDNADDPDDYTTLCGALRYSIEKLLTAYPKLRIYISLPVFRFWDENGVVSYSDTYTRYGHTLVDFCEALRGVAAEYKLPVIDGYNGLGINKLNATRFLSDGTHHTVAGRERFGRLIGASLTSQQEANPPGYSKKEIDSMFGSYVTDIDTLLGGG